MILIEGQMVPTGEGSAVRPMTLDDCIEWRNDLVDVTDAEELLDILIAEINRLNTENRRLRDVLEWVNTQCPSKCAGVKCAGVCDDALRSEQALGAEPAPVGPIPMLLEGVRDAENTLDPDDSSREEV